MSMSDKYFAGLDMGSAFTKAVVTCNKKMMASAVSPSGGNYLNAARRVLDESLSQAGIGFENLAGIVATGLGAGNCAFEARKVSDLSCQAMGCFCLFPSARTIIDIGGQFTKAARINPEGRLLDFLISEKCATGSGRFLQIIARILQINIEDIGPLSLKSQTPVEFSTNCAVFAESEAISRIAEGAAKEDILAGVHRAMASKVSMLVKRLKMEPDIVMSGGSSQDAGLVATVAQAVGMEILVPEKPMITAALGAACLAEDEPDI
ncbi:MAG: 2-hydroxyglutaryl-CoA dehydratase [Deltaproteobacteria bacterium]|nr:2-hydroxyglutaryl-CoA dehydratase [Deltaproteobacteria bacterium]